MGVPAKLSFQGEYGKKDFRVHCNVCNRAVEMWKIETPACRAPFDPSNAIDAIGAVRMQNTGEIIFTVECHGERFRHSNRRGFLSSGTL